MNEEGGDEEEKNKGWKGESSENRQERKKVEREKKMSATLQRVQNVPKHNPQGKGGGGGGMSL